MALKGKSNFQPMKKKVDLKKLETDKSEVDSVKNKHIKFDNDDDSDGEVAVKKPTVPAAGPSKAEKKRKNALDIGKQWYMPVC